MIMRIVNLSEVTKWKYFTERRGRKLRRVAGNKTHDVV